MRNIGLIVDSDMRIFAWQLEALRRINGVSRRVSHVIVVDSSKKREFKIRNILFYMLKVYSFRKSEYFRKKKINLDEFPSAKLVKCRAVNDGKWQVLPKTLKNHIQDCDIFIKFGMGLLRIKGTVIEDFHILSYHHGDPRYYRGRPPAFYELFKEEKVVGVIVQKLSDKLDGGLVLAQAESKILPYSYTKSLNRLYSTGIPLLARAVDYPNRTLEKLVNHHSGKYFTYPNNKFVALFILKLTYRSFLRVLYGLFIAKKWQISVIRRFNLEQETTLSLSQLEKNTLFGNRRGNSMADPVGLTKELIFFEKISKWNFGRIYASRKINSEIIFDVKLPKPGHYSFPTIVSSNKKNFILAETYNHCSPRLFELSETGFWTTTTYELKGLQHLRLIDPIYFSTGDLHFIFGSQSTDNQSLNLYISDSLLGPYHEHRQSPISLSPVGSRMAGPIHVEDERIYRFGQDCSDDYGNSVSIFRIEKLSRENYRERQVGRIKIEGAKGPHSLLMDNDESYVDFYNETFSISVGFWRILNIISCKINELVK